MNNRQSESLGYLIAVTALTKDGDPSQVEDEASLSMLGIYRGTEDQARGHLAELLKIGPPKWRWSKYGRFNELNHEIFSVLPYTALSLRQAHKLEITGYVDTANPDWAGLIELIGSGRTPNPGNLIGFEPYGGAIAAVSDGETAFPHRRQKLNIKINSYWSDAWKYNHTRASAQQWLDLVSAIISPALNGRTYVNYMREDIRDYRSAYWAQNFEKLLEIKTKLDPGQLFRFEQSIRKR